MKRLLAGLAIGLTLGAVSVAGAATVIHWPASCSQMACVNNHLNDVHTTAEQALTRTMTPGPKGETGDQGPPGAKGDTGAPGADGAPGQAPYAMLVVHSTVGHTALCNVVASTGPVTGLTYHLYAGGACIVHFADDVSQCVATASAAYQNLLVLHGDQSSLNDANSIIVIAQVPDPNTSWTRPDFDLIVWCPS